MDFVADLRAPTPSAAAELATPNRDDLLLDLDRLRAGLTGLLGASLGERERDLERLQGALRFVTPGKVISAARRDVLERQQRLSRAAGTKLERLRDRLTSATKALKAANPDQILARGYALVSDESGALIREATQVKQESAIERTIVKRPNPGQGR